MRCTKTMVIVALFFMLVYWGIRHSTAEASDYYLGEYPNGQIAYLASDSIREYQVTKNGYWVCDKYECYVKAVYPNSNEFERIFYEVTYSEGLIEYMVSKNGTKLYDRHTMNDFLRSHPVEKNMIDYFRSFRKQQGK